ncbi:MAG: hypothetical protein WCO09_03410, partial [bacterium]
YAPRSEAEVRRRLARAECEEEDVEAAVESAVRTFRPQDGGSWFYVEIDNGFPFRNVEALVRSFA